MEERFHQGIINSDKLLWDFPPGDWECSAQEVHCWVAWLNQPAATVTRLALLLSPDEMDRAARFRVSEPRNHFIVSRGLLRQILAHYLGMSPAEIHFLYGANGKPCLAPWLGKIQFNVSHSGQLAVFAVTREREVGIDIERVAPIPEASRIAAHFFPADEAAEVEVQRRPEVFYRYWTRREALLKCSGEGIGGAEDKGAEAVKASVCELKPARGYVGALAVKNGLLRLKKWRWPDMLAPTGRAFDFAKM